MFTLIKYICIVLFQLLILGEIQMKRKSPKVKYGS